MKKRKLLFIIVIPAIILISTGVTLGINGFFGGGGSLPEDTFSRGLVGYWAMDEGYGTSTYDGSGNGNDGMMYSGMATSSWTTGKLGGALKFDGVDDYVNAGSGASFNITDEITIEAWIKLNAVSTSNIEIVKKGGDIYYPRVNSQSYLVWGSSGLGELIDNTSPLSANQWYHVVFTYSDTADSRKIYLNGKEIKSQTISGSLGTPSGILTIGAYNDSGVNSFNGLIDEVRIYNRALSDAEVKYHYNRGGPVAYWKLDEGSGSTAYDSAGVSTSTIDGVLYGEMATSTTFGWTTGKYGTALKFDGVDDYMDAGSSTVFDFGTSGFTWELWLKKSSIETTDEQIVMDIEDIGGGDSDRLAFWIPGTSQSDTGKLKWQYEPNGATSRVTSSARIDDSTWHQIVGIFNGSSIKLFIDGVEQGFLSVTAVSLNFNSNLAIARRSSDASKFFRGIIDDVRIYNYVRTSDEIRLDYNAGFGAKFGYSLGSCERDPASCMLAGLVGYWSMDERYSTSTADGSGNSNNGMLIGGMATTSWTTGVRPLTGGISGGGALKFDGVDDYVDAGTGSNLHFSGNFTVEAWVKIPAMPDTVDEMIVGDYNGAYKGYKFDVNTSGEILFQVGRQSDSSINQVYSTQILSLNTWYHLVGVYDGAPRVYVNGVVTNGDAYSPIEAEVANTIIGKAQWYGKYFNGLIDDVRIYNRALSAEEVRYHYNKGGPVAYWKMDEGTGRTVYDSTPNNSDGTLILAGSATSSAWVSGKYGTALSFDGTDDYVDCGTNSSLFSGTGNVTFESWLKTTNNDSNYRVFLFVGSKIPKQSIYLAKTNDGYFTFGTYAIGTNSVPRFLVSLGNDGKWHHIVGIKSGDTLSLYLDGIFMDSDVVTSINVTAGNCYIGWSNTAGQYYDGLLDDVRIYNYARTPEQIRQDYNAGLAAKLGPSGKDCKTDPASCVSEGLAGYWSMDERNGTSTPDGSGNSNDGMMNGGMATTSWTNGVRPLTGGVYGGGALKFDGIDDYVDAGNAASLDPDTSSFSAELWAKITSKSIDQHLVSKMKNGSNWPGYTMYIQGSTGYLFSELRANGIDYNSNGTVNYADSNWHHFVLTVIPGSSTGKKLYVDGVLVATTDVATLATISTTNNLFIGKYRDASSYFNGTIDEVRIYNRALSDEEVRYHYNKGGPVGYWKMDEGEGRKVYDSTNNNNDGTLVLVGSATSSAWVEGKSGGALSFDGVDDYVSIPDSASLKPTVAVTAEVWVKPRPGYGLSYPRIFEKTDSRWMYFTSSNGKITTCLTIASVFNCSFGSVSVIPVNTWSHLVMTYDGITYKLYINGVLDYINSNYPGALGTSSSSLFIGNDGTAPFRNFNGLLDDARVYNYARTEEQIRQDYNIGLSTHFK